MSSLISKMSTLAIMGLFSLISTAGINTDVYDVKMRLDIPRVYDNMQSLGYRKYQKQTIKGKMYIDYENDSISEIRFGDFVNNTYDVNGIPVTYRVLMDDEQLHSFSWCGDNKKNRFTKPNFNLHVVMIPSYKKGYDMLDDVHLSISCTRGSLRYIYIEKTKIQIPYILNGYCCGQIGCNCVAWGHISPTRFWGYFGPSDHVTDIASVSGLITVKWNKKESRR